LAEIWRDIRQLTARINDGESQVHQSFNIQYSMSPSRTSSYRNLMTVPEVDIATP